jgi:acetyltransferase-like isoleucine patch superfamily enzyme
MKQRIAFLLSKIFIAYYKCRYGKKISWGKNIIVNHKFKFSGKGKLVLQDGVNLWAHAEKNIFQTFSPIAEIIIGKNSRLNGGFFQCREKIEIGENCLVGSCHLMDTDFHHADPEKRLNTKNIPTKKIKVGKNVWLAGQSAVLKGVTIGDNAVVAFRSVVVKDVEANTVVAGNPGREVKRI